MKQPVRLLDGQVTLWELLALVSLSFLTYAIGYSLPLLAAILFLIWPLLLVQMVGEGLFLGLGLMIRKLWERGRPPAPPPEPAVKRYGAARFLWFLPMLTMAAGYLVQYRDTGLWFL